MDKKVKLLIVDDEYLIRNLVKMRVDWEAEGFEIVGEAENAAQALAQVESKRPDVVFTDICMPGIDGIEMGAQIRSLCPDCKIVVITGYAEFSYAQKGLRLGVEDYLLKPIREKQLLEVARRLRKDLLREWAQRHEMEQLRKEFEETKPLLREKFLCNLLQTNLEPGYCDAQFALFDLPFRARQGFTVALVELGHIHGNRDQALEMMNRIRAIQTGRALEPPSQTVLYSDGLGRLVALAQPGGDLLPWCEGLCEALVKALGVRVSIGIGRKAADCTAIPACARQAEAALAYRVVAGNNQVISYDDITQPPHIPQTPYRESMDRLAFYISAGLVDKALEALERLTGTVRGEQALAQTRLICMDTVALCHHIMAEQKLDYSSEKETLALLFADNLPEIRQGLAASVAGLANKIKSRGEDKSRDISQEVVGYITQHLYDPELRVADVAAHFYLSVGYLSRLVKQHTGQSFVEYITERRMKRAAELLLGTNLKSYEIGSRVGVEDAHYFSILFKKQFGQSPNEYRKGIKSEQK